MGAILKLIGLVVVLAFGWGLWNGYDLCNKSPAAQIASVIDGTAVNVPGGDIPLIGGLIWQGYRNGANWFCEA